MVIVIVVVYFMFSMRMYRHSTGNRTGRNGSSSSRDVAWFSTSSSVVCVLFTVVVNIVVVVGCVYISMLCC